MDPRPALPVALGTLPPESQYSLNIYFMVGVVSIASCVCVLGATGFTPMHPTHDLTPWELASRVAARLDATGCIRAEYENDISHDRYLIGFNLADRSWYKIHRGAFMGFTPGSGFYQGKEGGPAELHVPEERFFERWPHEYIPSLYVLAVCEAIDAFHSVQAGPNDAVIVTLNLPDGQPMPQALFERWLRGTRPAQSIQTSLEIDASGLLRRVDSAVDALDRDIVYATESPAGLPLAAYVGAHKPGGLQLMRFTYEPAGCAADFQPDAVARVAKIARTSIRIGRLNPPRGAQESGPGANAALAPAVPGPIERARRPLAIAGALVILVGILAWWRTRR